MTSIKKTTEKLNTLSQQYFINLETKEVTRFILNLKKKDEIKKEKFKAHDVSIYRNDYKEENPIRYLRFSNEYIANKFYDSVKEYCNKNNCLPSRDEFNDLEPMLKI